MSNVDLKKYKEQTKDAAEFLNQFVWPIRYRYISAYNEMNDSKFWYGKIDPEGYAELLDYTISTFKKENNDFFKKPAVIIAKDVGTSLCNLKNVNIKNIMYKKIDNHDVCFIF